MNDDSKGMPEPRSAAIGRRDLLKKGAAAGAIAWTTPMVLSRAASAAEGGGGTGKCRPTITVKCLNYYCDQGGKWFPGITVEAGPCTCADTETYPAVCVKFGTISSGCNANVAYGQGTDCTPLQGDGANVILSTGGWECVDSDYQIFFGRPRAGNGAIPDFGTNCQISFDVAVWAGGCPDQDEPTGAYNCQTYSVVLVWDNGNNTIMTCVDGVVGAPSSITAAATSMCTDVDSEQPCTCP